MKEIKGIGLHAQVICDQCNTKRVLRSTDVHKGKYEINGESIQLMYFDCQVCGKRHYVQIDTNRTIDLLKEVSRLMTKLMVLKRKDKPIPQKQSDKFKREREHLAKIRINLMKEYNEKPCKDIETGEEFILRFTVC